MSAEKPAEPKKSGKKKLIIMVAAGLLIAGGAGGGGWYFSQRGHGAEGKQAHVEEKKPAKKALFTPLDPFTVNLQDGRGERFAQIGVTLQTDDPMVEAEIKERLPAVRNAILLLISSRRAEELLTDEGKKDLAAQIRIRAGQTLGVEMAKLGGVQDVLFSQFIVQ